MRLSFSTENSICPTISMPSRSVPGFVVEGGIRGGGVLEGWAMLIVGSLSLLRALRKLD